MRITIHRGARQIGGSCVEIRSTKARVLVDIGLPLESSGLSAGALPPGVDAISKKDGPSLDGVILSHGHLDHYGLLDRLPGDVPVYLSAGTSKILGISAAFGMYRPRHKRPEIMIAPGRPFRIKDLLITPYQMDHSAFDALAFLIEGEGKRVFYTGDFRFHGRKGALVKRLMESPPPKIDCLILEGTRVGGESIGAPGEKSVEDRITRVLRSNAKPTFFVTSSQNIDRLVSAYRACKRTGSFFIIDLYTAYVLDRLQTPKETLPQYSWDLVRVTVLDRHRDRLLEAGQGEFLQKCLERRIRMAEILERGGRMLFMVRDNLVFRHFLRKYPSVLPTTLVYSMWEGYLTDEFRAFCRENRLDLRLIHSSGHAPAAALRRFADALDARTIIPIHTGCPDRYPEVLGRNVRVLPDGEVFDL